ncbi:MAG: RagB/SusD family nutrient uptake outer membrane protein [Cyclobacteriaceae bacterium]|nr:RagB/SusD family nutrient uptake outer membrane protein [Cyclobacteriaceae bacterium]
MKKILSLILMIAAVSSCDILEPEPFTALDANNAVVSGASAQTVLRGAYAAMQHPDYYGIEYICNNDLIADNAIYQGFFDSQLELDQMAVPFANLWVNNAWFRIYRVISIANLLIAQVPDLEDPNLSDTARNRILGQAYAIRALAHFDLLRYFGEHYDAGSSFGIPLVTEPILGEIPDITRASVADTYSLIMGDIQEAESKLQGFNDVGAMNYWALISLRSRVNLYRKNYTAAFNDANTVIGSGRFSLVGDLVGVLYSTSTSAETIFDLEFNDQDQSSFNVFLIRRDEYNVDSRLLAAFEPGDRRRELFDFLRNANRCFKYPDGTGADNAKIFRLAELLLIRSEAAAMAQQDPNAGLDDLNLIRQRAGLAPLTGFSTMDEFVAALLQERRIELSYEGHRFFDLVRFNKIQEVLGINENFRRILPIPRDELQVSDVLVQNPGYETL